MVKGFPLGANATMIVSFLPPLTEFKAMRNLEECPWVRGGRTQGCCIDRSPSQKMQRLLQRSDSQLEATGVLVSTMMYIFSELKNETHRRLTSHQAPSAWEML